MIAKACIFDFDGVVIDSEKYHHIAWEQLAHAIGTEFSYEEYQPFKSAGRQAVIPYLMKKAGMEFTQERYDYFHHLRSEKISDALHLLCEDDIIDGVVDFVKLLRTNHIPVAVASASASAHLVAQRFGIFELFDVFVDGMAKLPHKPKPDMFLHAAQLLNVPSGDCVVFEDSINGLLAAKNAQMHCVGVQTYFTDLADKIIDDFVGADLSLLQFEDDK